ncbi:extensin-like [Girardinichthys multiradiatus]|uniref:extensin-like n=1 Tax=Girardinichthys multiradiatus TaxID=208333 RepID=UPI001FAB7801|nr:extensin-like [Girardinichthys multiradiatus]
MQAIPRTSPSSIPVPPPTPGGKTTQHQGGEPHTPQIPKDTRQADSVGTAQTTPPTHRLQPLHATPQPTAPIPPRPRQPAEQHTSKPAQPLQSLQPHPTSPREGYMHLPGTWAMQANRSRPSTTHQPPRCSHKTCSATPPTQPQPSARPWARTTEGSSGRRPRQHQLPGTPPTPPPNPGGAPAHRPPAPLHGAPQPTKQSSGPAPPPKQGHIPIKSGTPPAGRHGPKARG